MKCERVVMRVEILFGVMSCVSELWVVGVSLFWVFIEMKVGVVVFGDCWLLSDSGKRIRLLRSRVVYG